MKPKDLKAGSQRYLNAVSTAVASIITKTQKHPQVSTVG